MNDVLVTLVSEDAGVTKGLTRRVLKSLVRVLPDMIGKYGRVRVADLGIFYKRELPERRSRNPHTGKTITVGPTGSVRFKPSRSLRLTAKSWLDPDVKKKALAKTPGHPANK